MNEHEIERITDVELTELLATRNAVFAAREQHIRAMRDLDRADGAHNYVVERVKQAHNLTAEDVLEDDGTITRAVR